MKAKQYAQTVIDNDFSIESLVEITKAMIDEVKTICDQRKCQSESVINSVFKEIDQKYRATCRIINKEKPIMNEKSFKKFMRELYKDIPRILELEYFSEGESYEAILNQKRDTKCH